MYHDRTLLPRAAWLYRFLDSQYGFFLFENYKNKMNRSVILLRFCRDIGGYSENLLLFEMKRFRYVRRKRLSEINNWGLLRGFLSVSKEHSRDVTRN